MTVTIYGIKNCDTMKKAFSWLDSHGVAYTFHDYRVSGIEEGPIAAWCKAAGWEKVLNKASRTFRALPGSAGDLTEARAISLMVSEPTIIKRPVLDANGRIEVGFKPDRYAEIFG